MRPLVVSFFTAGTQYERDARKLATSCQRFGYDLDMTPINQGALSWDEVTRLKPQIVRQAAQRHPDRSLLLLDADCWFARPVPWLEQEHGVDVACWQLDPATDLRVGTFIQRHKHQGFRRGSLWASGRVLFRPESLGQILDEWEAVNRERRNDWGDQLNLQIACGRIGATSLAMPSNLIEDIDHRSGFRLAVKRHPVAGRPVPERKVVLMGSAPGVVEWWKRARDWYWREGFTVAAINNAWRVPDLGDLDLWLAPADFAGPEPPPCVPRNSTIGYREQGYRVEERFANWVIGPYWVRKVRTTATDALVHLLNEAIHDEVKLTVHVAGCDMVYPSSGPSHFYGNGPADPLRYTQEQLAKALLAVQGFYEKAGATLRNVSGQVETRLPWERLEVAA